VPEEERAAAAVHLAHLALIPVRGSVGTGEAKLHCSSGSLANLLALLPASTRCRLPPPRVGQVGRLKANICNNIAVAKAHRVLAMPVPVVAFHHGGAQRAGGGAAAERRPHARPLPLRTCPFLLKRAAPCQHDVEDSVFEGQCVFKSKRSPVCDGGGPSVSVVAAAGLSAAGLSAFEVEVDNGAGTAVRTGPARRSMARQMDRRGHAGCQ
jgi:hypothetical protein